MRGCKTGRGANLVLILECFQKYSGIIHFSTDVEPETVTLYYARTQSRKRRDFRLVYIGCPDKDENGKRAETETCECPKSQAKSDEEGKETKGICPQFLFWQRNKLGERRLVPDFIGAQTTTKQIHTGKYEYTYEGTITIAEDDDYFVAAFMEFKFPGVGNPITVGVPDPVDHEKRGKGLTVSSQMAVVPNYRPYDCYKESCVGSLV